MCGKLLHPVETKACPITTGLKNVLNMCRYLSPLTVEVWGLINNAVTHNCAPQLYVVDVIPFNLKFLDFPFPNI